MDGERHYFEMCSCVYMQTGSCICLEDKAGLLRPTRAKRCLLEREAATVRGENLWRRLGIDHEAAIQRWPVRLLSLTDCVQECQARDQGSDLVMVVDVSNREDV